MTMHIDYGPFCTAYHHALVDDTFRADFERFIATVLMPQADEPCLSIEGTLSATVNEDRFCGQNSLVRNLFHVALSIRLPSGTATFNEILKYKDGSFISSETESPLLWTPAYRAKHDRQVQAIEQLCHEIKNGQEHRSCPVCGMSLSIADIPDLFGVMCLNLCFKYSFHRDHETGEFLHGHFFVKSHR